MSVNNRIADLHNTHIKGSVVAKFATSKDYGRVERD